MITQEQYEDIGAREAMLKEWIKSNGYLKRNGWSAYPSDAVPGNCKVTNEERSEVELYEWMTNPPDKYLLYIFKNREEGGYYAGTWTGTKLGSVIMGREYRCPAFGRWCSVRVPITVIGENEKIYWGTYYTSSGDYARIRQFANQKDAVLTVHEKHPDYSIVRHLLNTS